MPSARKQKKKEEPEVEEDWVACDNCGSWVRLVGFTGSCSLEEVTTKKMSCKNCARFKSLETEMQLLRSELAKQEKPSSWCDIVKKVPEMHNMKVEMEKLMERTNNLTASQLRQATEESREIEKRKMNLIVSGLTESDVDLKNLIRYANETCRLAVPMSETDFDFCMRLGKMSNRPRLLKIGLRSLPARRALLTMRAEGETSQPLQERIYIRPDYTRTQELNDKQLRSDLLIAGKDTHKISRGRIIKRCPNANTPAADDPSSSTQGTSKPSHPTREEEHAGEERGGEGADETDLQDNNGWSVVPGGRSRGRGCRAGGRGAVGGGADGGRSREGVGGGWLGCERVGTERNESPIDRHSTCSCCSPIDRHLTGSCYSPIDRHPTCSCYSTIDHHPTYPCC